MTTKTTSATTSKVQAALAELLADKGALAEAMQNPEVRKLIAQTSGAVAEEESVRNVAVKLGKGDDVHLVDLVGWMNVKKGPTTYVGTTFDISNMRGAIRLQISEKRVEKDPTVITRAKEWSVKAALLALELGL